MNGGVGNNTLIGGSGNDSLVAHSGKASGRYDTSINFVSGNNKLDGGSGDDALIGGLGSDTLIGGSGNDTLNGGLGSDTLTGGDGADSFRFVAPNQGVGTITDFSVGVDTINVAAAIFGGGLTSGKAITAEQFRLGKAAS